MPAGIDVETTPRRLSQPWEGAVPSLWREGGGAWEIIRSEVAADCRRPRAHTGGLARQACCSGGGTDGLFIWLFENKICSNSLTFQTITNIKTRSKGGHEEAAVEFHTRAVAPPTSTTHFLTPYSHHKASVHLLSPGKKTKDIDQRLARTTKHTPD